MQFLNKLDIYCLIIFIRFNLFLSCSRAFVVCYYYCILYLVHYLQFYGFVFLTFFLRFLQARSNIECFSAYNYYNTRTTSFVVLPLRGIIEPMFTSILNQAFSTQILNYLLQIYCIKIKYFSLYFIVSYHLGRRLSIL